MSRSRSRGRNPPSSTVGHLLGPTTLPNETATNVSAPATVQPPTCSGPRPSNWLRPQTTHISRSPSPDWRPSPGIVDGPTDDEEDSTHFTLKKSIDPSKYTHLFRIKPKLNATNYAIWGDTILRALQTVSLHVYLNADFTPTDSLLYKHEATRWHKANLFVCSALAAAMTEERQQEIGHLPSAAEIWMEARRLYMDTTATNWTLTITALATARYTDGEDVATHITRMKTYRRDLLIMQRDIDDELFACFLRISMPSNWNYVFTALPEHYTSAEIERRIRHEYGMRMSQSNITPQTVRTEKKGRAYCDNCKKSGHWTEDCHAPGGAMHGKTRGSKPKDRGQGSKDDKSCRKKS